MRGVGCGVYDLGCRAEGVGGVRAAHPSGCAGCGAGASFSAIKRKSLWGGEGLTRAKRRRGALMRGVAQHPIIMPILGGGRLVNQG